MIDLVYRVTYHDPYRPWEEITMEYKIAVAERVHPQSRDAVARGFLAKTISDGPYEFEVSQVERIS